MAVNPEGDWRKKLQGHSPGTVLAFERYLQSKDPSYLDSVVIEILRYYHPDPANLHPESFSPEKHLSQDLGIDSVAMVEAVFLMEDLLEISIPNEDLNSIQTFGDLKAYLRSRLDAAKE